MRNLKRQSQAKPLKRTAVFFQVTSAVMHRGVVLGREFHELLDRQVTQFSGASQGDLVLPIEFDCQQFRGLDRCLVWIQSCRSSEVCWDFYPNSPW